MVVKAGLAALHGPHHVAEKQMTTLALAVLKSFTESAVSSSFSVILIIPKLFV